MSIAAIPSSHSGQQTMQAGGSITEAWKPRRYRADLLLYLVMFYTWIGIWRVQDIISILGKIQFPILTEMATLALFVADRSPVRKIKWINSPPVKITLLLLVIMIVGLPFSLWPGKGVDFIAKDFIPTLLLMIVVATSLRELSDLEWLAFAHMIGGLVYAFYVFRYCPVGSNGRLGNLVFYDANDFALIMVCTIPFAVYFLRPGVVVWRRLLALAALGMFVLMIIRSGSRGGFMGLIAVMAYTLLRYRAIPARSRIAAVAAGALMLVAFGSANYWTMMQTILHPNDDYNMTQETGRKAIWKRGLLYMQMRPVTGVGIRAFPQAEGQLSPVARAYAASGRGIKWSVAHNSFVEIGAECGVIALAAFLGMFFITFRNLSRVRSGPRGSPWVTPADRAYSQMLIASLLGFMVCGFFVSAEYFAYLYVLFGLTVAQGAILRRRALRGPQVARPATQRPLARRTRAKVQWLPSAS